MRVIYISLYEDQLLAYRKIAERFIICTDINHEDDLTTEKLSPYNSLEHLIEERGQYVLWDTNGSGT